MVKFSLALVTGASSGIGAALCRIIAQKKIPLIIPLILYAGKHPWNVSLDIRDLIDAPQELISKILNKPPHLIDATQLSDDVLVTQAWSNAMIYFLKHAWDRDALVYMRSIMGNLRWLEEVGGISGSNLVITFVNYVITNGEIKGSEEIKTLIDSLANELCPRTGAEIMTIAQRLREEGLQQGLHQGVQQGVHTGESNLLIILLTEKFHHVPEHYLREIKTANTDLIKKWVKYALRAEKIEEVFKKH